MKKYLPKFENPAARLPGGKKLEPGPSQLDFMNKALSSTSGIKVVNTDANLQNSWKANVEASIKENVKPDKKNTGSQPGLSTQGAGIMGTISKGVGMATDLMTSAIDVDENSSFELEQATGDALLRSGNPYAMLAGAVVKTNSALNQAMGTNTNTISKKEASEVGIGGAGRVINNVAGFLANTSMPGLGAAFGKTDSVKMTEQTKSLSNAFAGSVDDIQTAEGMSEGRYIIGKNKINNTIREAQRQNDLISKLAVTNTQRKASDYGLYLAQQNFNRYAGNNYQNMHVGKHGMKLMNIEECRRILEARKEEVQSFHNGGVIGVDVNVIPEGKYHAHKNHLGDLSEEFEDLTKKGIPVVAHSEGGEIEQVAEIEKMELIFRLEVTEKLEELFKDGSDEAMIEAGKLVAYEIMENTQDNSGEVLKDE